MKHNIILGTAVAALATGCMGEPDASQGGLETQHHPAQVEESTLFQGAEDGSMLGKIGPATVNQTPDHLNVYDDGWYTSVESVAVLPDRAAMILVSMANARDILVPGFAATFRLEDFESQTQVTVLGCTGQDVDIYDEYDVPADEVDVSVEEAEGNALRVQVEGRWSQDLEQTTASASFTLTP